MNRFDFRDHLQRHNRIVTAKAVGFAIAGLLGWFGSYWAVWGIAWMVQGHYRGINNVDALLTRMIAWGAMLLFAVEMVRYGRARRRGERRRDALADAAEDYADDYLGQITGNARGHVLSTVFFWLLLIGPRASGAAWASWQQRITLSKSDAATAESLVHRLGTARQWVPVTQLGKSIPALGPLDQLGLIWTRNQQGTTEVRLSPSITAHHFADGA